MKLFLTAGRGKLAFSTSLRRWCAVEAHSCPMSGSSPLATASMSKFTLPRRHFGIALFQHLQHTASNLSVTHTMLPFFASGGLDFRFWDYFQLVARCIVHACAWRCNTMSPIHIICPKSQHGMGNTQAAGSMHM